MRTGIKRLLGVHGFHSTLFQSAGALLNCDDFDKAFCVIMDINLNGDSGIELCRRLADSGVSLPVVYITGNDSEANRAGAIRSGCIAYLTKPFAASALIDSVKKAHDIAA
jgi:FixJ family two-component response regulator